MEVSGHSMDGQTMDGQSMTLTAGEGVWIPAGTSHQVRNESAEDVHFLVISQPPSHGDRENAERRPVFFTLH
jgi:mannose-6-phosphate isomerase-like protein (cupin superfamily)